MRPRPVLCCLSLALLAVAGCSRTVVETPLKTFPVSSSEGVLTEEGVEFDAAVSSDGDGSLKITADQPTTIALYEAGDVDAEATRLIYRAQLRSENLQGQAYLEMWCVFEGQGEFFSRGLDAPLSGTQDWTYRSTPFFLQAGQNPSNVKLNLVINGSGTVWIDEITLTKTE